MKLQNGPKQGMSIRRHRSTILCHDLLATFSTHRHTPNLLSIMKADD